MVYTDVKCLRINFIDIILEMNFLYLATVISVVHLSIQSDLVSYNVKTQSICSETGVLRPTRDCRWHADLDVMAAEEVLGNGCRIIAFKLQWFSGSWSGWFVVGVNDIDIKFNKYASTCYKGRLRTVVSRNTMRRWWSYFYDHNHKYIKCCPRKNSFVIG